VGEPLLLSQFFRDHGGRVRDEFLAEFDGAFILARFHGSPPTLSPLSRDPEKALTIGSDEDCDLDFDDPTLDAVHAVITYHPGFRGWTIEDKGTNFGTHVDGDRIGSERATLLADKGVIKPGGGLCELQFYASETLYDRIKKAGVTRSLSRLRRPGSGRAPRAPGS